MLIIRKGHSYWQKIKKWSETFLGIVTASKIALGRITQNALFKRTLVKYEIRT